MKMHLGKKISPATKLLISAIFILQISSIFADNGAGDDGLILPNKENIDFKVGLVRPMVRNTTNFATNSYDSICSETERQEIHYITTQGTLNKFSWVTNGFVPNSTCQFRISEDLDQGNDDSYVTLVPEDTDGLFENGSFYCGSQVYEEKLFVIPSDIDCDNCILEWIWRTPSGYVARQCADIMVSVGLEKDCLGKCVNGGVCRRGECICKPGYSGTYCENAPGVFSNTLKEILKIIFYIILSIVLIVTIIYILYWCAQKKIEDGRGDQIYHTNFTNKDNKNYSQFDDDGIEMNRVPNNNANNNQ